MIFLYVLENLLFPPASTLILALSGAILYWKGHRRIGASLGLAGLLLLYIAGLPLTSLLLSRSLESYPALDAGDCSLKTRAQAIVVLAYTRDEEGREFGGPMSSGEEMERLRYAAYLYHCLRLPVIVVGGDALDTGVRQADLMRHTLERYFGVPVRSWDGRSNHTWDNAAYARELLQQRKRILLVTHAWHMKRARRLFVSQGFEVTPAPTGFTSFNPISRGFYALIPSAGALRHNKRLVHEWVGIGLHYLRQALAASDLNFICPERSRTTRALS